MFERASRWAGRGAVLLGITVFVFNLGWIGTHWSEVRPVAPGDIAPPFVLPRADGGGEIDLAGLRGKVVLVDFWATWCKPCVGSMPVIERVYKRFHNDGFEVLSVNTEGADAGGRALAFARELGLTFPIVVDDGHASILYRVTTIPHMVLIDAQGVVREVHRGVGRDFESHLAGDVLHLIRER